MEWFGIKKAPVLSVKFRDSVQVLHKRQTTNNMTFPTR